MSQAERLGRDERLSSATRMVVAEIVRLFDPLTGRARITAEELADRLDIAVGTIRKATGVLTARSYFQKVKVGRNIDPYLTSRERESIEQTWLIFLEAWRPGPV